METETLCAIKIIHDAIKNLEIKVREYKIPYAMLKYGSRAKAKYYIHIETVKSQIAEKMKVAAVEEKVYRGKEKIEAVRSRSKCMFEIS